MLSAGAAPLEGSTGAGGPTSRKAPSCVAGCWQEASVPQYEDLSAGCSRVLVILQLASPGASDARQQNGSQSISDDLAWKSHCLFCPIWCQRV